MLSGAIKGNISLRSQDSARRHRRPRMRIHAHSLELFSVDGLVGRSDGYRKFFGKLVVGLRVVVLLPGSAVSEKMRRR
jgi:hypothetical protein